MSLVTIVINTIKVWMTDIKEFSELNKKNLAIFHPKFEVYDRLITILSIFIILVAITLSALGYPILSGFGFGLFIIIFTRPFIH